MTWNNLHGDWFVTTVMGVNYLAEHFSPALVIVSPVFLAWPNVEALLVLQAVAVAAAGMGPYVAARTRTGDSPPALLIQVAYHLAPATGWVVLDEFYPISVALPAVTAATAALWAKRVRLAVCYVVGILGLAVATAVYLVPQITDATIPARLARSPAEASSTALAAFANGVDLIEARS